MTIRSIPPSLASVRLESKTSSVVESSKRTVEGKATTNRTQIAIRQSRTSSLLKTVMMTARISVSLLKGRSLRTTGGKRPPSAQPERHPETCTTITKVVLILKFGCLRLETQYPMKKT